MGPALHPLRPGVHRKIGNAAQLSTASAIPGLGRQPAQYRVDVIGERLDVHLTVEVTGPLSPPKASGNRRAPNPPALLKYRLFVSDNHPDANSEVAQLIAQFGFEPIDLGRNDQGGLLQQIGGH